MPAIDPVAETSKAGETASAAGWRAQRPQESRRGISSLASLANAPAFWASLLLSLGILAAQAVWIVPGVLLLATIACAAIAGVAANRAPRMARLPLICCWLLLGLFLSEAHRAPGLQRALVWLADQNTIEAIAGSVTRTTPVRIERSTLPYAASSPHQETSESIDVAIDSVDGKPIDGGLRATIYSPADRPFPELRCGDRVEASLAMHPPEHYLDPGVWDSTQWLAGQGIGVIGSIKAASLQVLPGRRHAFFLCRLHSWQQAGTQRLLDFAATAQASGRLPSWLRLTPQDAGMLSAMVLGDRTYLNREERAGFERTGSFHLVVVSGMHLALFAGFIFGISAFLGLPRVWSTALTIACSFAYALFTGFGDPVQRAFWMVAIFLIARILFRERNSLNAAGFAALCLIAYNPLSLMDSSFQMTLLAVVVIAGIAAPLAERTFAPFLRAAANLQETALDAKFVPRMAQFRVTLRFLCERLRPLLGRRAAELWFPASIRLGLRVLEVLLISFAIELAMSLPMAAYFHRITLLALPVNFLVMPLIAMALPFSIATFLCILISPALAWPLALCTAALLHAITGIVGRFSMMAPSNLRVPAPGAYAVALSILFIGAAVWTANSRRPPIGIPILALACSAACALFPARMVSRPDTLQVTAIDVGQGDSLLLITPQGKTVLVDAGGPIGGEQESDSNFDIGEDVVSPVLWSMHIRRLDAVELTHAHSDHMGGMPAVLRNFRPKELWVGKNPPDASYEALLMEARSLGVEVHRFAAGDSFDFGGVHVNVLSPARNYTPRSAPSNDDSLVLRLAYRQSSVLLEGDAEAPSERHMLGEKLASDLLKVGHHGSKTSTIPPFLAAVHPAYAIISVGHRNPYGHPKLDVLERLQAEHVLTYRTDALGATSFYLNGSMIRATPLAAR